MSAAFQKLDNLKAILKSCKGEGNYDLSQHIAAIFNRILMNYPHDGLDRFEEISIALKNERRSGAGGNKDDVKNYKKLSQHVEPYLNECKKLFERVVVGEDENPEPTTLGYVPDLLSESKMFEWAGISFGDDETYRLWKSMKKLETAINATSLRFWGKIYGKIKDYYIVEAVLESGGDEGELPADQEARGTGVNKFVYYVTNSVFDDWKQLPDINPSHIKIARHIKYIFTGDMEADVITNPHFKGKEKHLLHAQISRITHGTTVVPSGIYRTVEDNDKEIEMIPEEEFKQKSTHELVNINNWVHYLPGILKTARTTHIPPEAEEGQDPDELLKKLEQKDPYEKRLKPLNEDTGVTGLKKSWIIKLQGDSSLYQGLTPKDTSPFCYGIIVLKSLHWPGFTNVYQNGVSSSIYLGYGIKSDDLKNYPIYPPEVLEDPADLPEQPEPNGQLEEPKDDEMNNGD